MSAATAPIAPIAPLSRGSGVPLHVQAEETLRTLVREPRFRDGRLLPDEVSLAADLGVSRGTLREAIKRLVAEGLLERRSGVGTRVVQRRVDTAASGWPSFRREMRELGREVVELHTRWRRAAAGAAVAGALAVDPGERVWQLSRIRGTADSPGEREVTPAVWFRSWFLPALGDLQGIELGGGLYAGLGNATGAVPSRSDETLTAEAATRRTGAVLRVEPGSPVLMRRRVVFDGSGRAIEWAVNAYRADRFRYTVSLTAQSGEWR